MAFLGVPKYRLAAMALSGGGLPHPRGHRQFVRVTLATARQLRCFPVPSEEFLGDNPLRLYFRAFTPEFVHVIFPQLVLDPLPTPSA